MKDLIDLKDYIEEAQYQLDLAEEKRQAVEDYCDTLEDKLANIEDVINNEDLVDPEDKINEIRNILEV